MVNPFTLESRIRQIQQEVLRPLYSMHPEQEQADHAWLLAETGRAISRHRSFIEELCRSRLLAAIFKIVKFLGGAEHLTKSDFARFTAYVTDGGLQSMVRMLLSVDKENTFVGELRTLPVRVRRDAPRMLAKSNGLHEDFITGYFKEHYGSLQATPPKLRNNFLRSREFISRLVLLAEQQLKTDRISSKPGN